MLAQQRPATIRTVMHPNSSSWQYVGAIRAPLDLLGENLLDDFYRLNSILTTIFAQKALRLPTRGHSAIEVIFAILTPVENTAVLGMDILLRLGDDPCLGHLGLASYLATCLTRNFGSPHL